MFQEFKKFVLRGNVVDLAVGVVMGAAFAAVVSGFTAAFITPLIALASGESGFENLKFTIGGSSAVDARGRLIDPGTTFAYGQFIQAALSFVITAAVIFFFVVKPINHLLQRARKEEPEDPTTKKCPECLSEIAVDARRCAFCTTKLEKAA
jgi:large conductance mechanosensitive channel